MIKNPKFWAAGFFVIVTALLMFIVVSVIKIDPFFHYHYPDTEHYFYSIDNQRSQNDGILRNFPYEGIIAGTSMTQQFNVSEAEKLWGISFIKIPFSGGYFKEINENIEKGLSSHPDVRVVIRGLDMTRIFKDKDAESDSGIFPLYLYDKDPFNDVKYLMNRDVFFKRIYEMVRESHKKDFSGGITSFDEYGLFSSSNVYGRKTLFPKGIEIKKPGNPQNLTESERKMILDSIRQNVTELPDQYPDVTFYYFFTPYSIGWWKDRVDNGSVYKYVEALRFISEEILKHKNIKLYCFHDDTDIVADLNNYKDIHHYGIWINSIMLRYMYEEKYILFEQNYNEHFDDDLNLLLNFDYAQLDKQEDYQNDFYAAALWNERIYDVRPVEIQFDYDLDYELSCAELKDDQYEGKKGVICRGRLDKNNNDDVLLGDYLHDIEYIGFRINKIDITPFHQLVFYGKKNAGNGQPTVFIYDENGNVLAELTKSNKDIANGWQQYLLDVSKISGDVTIIFNGGYPDNSGSGNSEFVFSNITLY